VTRQPACGSELELGEMSAGQRKPSGPAASACKNSRYKLRPHCNHQQKVRAIGRLHISRMPRHAGTWKYRPVRAEQESGASAHETARPIGDSFGAEDATGFNEQEPVSVRLGDVAPAAFHLSRYVRAERRRERSERLGWVLALSHARAIFDRYEESR